MLHKRIASALADRLTPQLTSYADLIPAGLPDTVRERLTALAQAADDRRRELGERVAADPPHWAPLGDGRGRIRGDVDHLVVGPSGVVTINTKNHRTGRLHLDADELILNGRPTEYVPKARREAKRVTEFLRPALAAAGSAELAARLPVRPLVVIVGGRLTVDRWPSGATVVMLRTLVEALRAFPMALDADAAAAVYAIARRSTTWNPVTRR